jgi:hypothetical protein
MAFDPICYGVALHFLSGNATVKQAADLAQHIQDAAEEWLRAHPDPPHQETKG